MNGEEWGSPTTLRSSSTPRRGTGPMHTRRSSPPGTSPLLACQSTSRTMPPSTRPMSCSTSVTMGSVQMTNLLWGWMPTRSSNNDRWGQSPAQPGEAIFLATSGAGGKIPPQDVNKPTHFPYNTALRPRRLDYLITHNTFLDEIHVGEVRDIVGSDHEPVLAVVPGGKRPISQLKCTWGAKQLKTTPRAIEKMNALLDKQEDHHRVLAAAAEAITEQKKGEKFVESRALKDIRRLAHQAPPGEARRQLWKTICKQRKEEHKEWVRELARRAGGQDWGAYRALRRTTKPSQWDNYLKEKDGWQKDARDHFQTIFGKIDREKEKADWDEETKRRQCKDTPWRPFTEMELRVAMQGWKWGKATGVDGIAHEALLYLLEHPKGKTRILEAFNDALYTGKASPDMLQGLTVLLPKAMLPKAWGIRDRSRSAHHCSNG